MKKDILAIVRGESSWEILRSSGVSQQEDHWIFPPSKIDPVEIHVSDLKAGILKHSTNKEKAIEWAKFILSASDLVSFDKIEGDPEGESVIENIWDLAYS